MSVGELLKSAKESFFSFGGLTDDRPIIKIELSNAKKGLSGETPFSGLTIEYEVGAGVSACSFNVPVPTDYEENYNLLELIMPVSDTRVIIKRKGNEVFNGFVDKWVPGVTETGQVINLQCRSIGRDAVDSDWYKYFYFNQIAFPTLLRYIGGQDIYKVPNISLRNVNVDKGTKVFEKVSKLASDVGGYWAIPTVSGVVEFVKLPSTRDPVASFIEGEGNITSITTEYDLSKRFKNYIGVGNRSGAGARVEIIDKEIEDLGIQGRYQFFTPKNTSSNLREAVKRKMSLDLIDSFTCVLGLSSWEIDGGIWQPGVLLELQSPSNFIFKPYKFAVRKVSLQLDDTSGEKCELTLTLPNAFDNTPPTSVPWELPPKREMSLIQKALGFIGF
jgi:prophage tail gpP-like protein